MNVTFKFNGNPVAAFRHVLKEYAAVAEKDSPEGLAKLLLQSSRRFVRNVADITPPAQGKADAAAKKRGENAIVADLLKIAQPVAIRGASRMQAKELLITGEQLLERHKAARGSNGRIPRDLKNKPLIEQAQFTRAAKVLMAQVGWLAAGLNAAAAKLGIRLPSWIARHGAKYGKVDVSFTPLRLRVRIVQDVPFTDNVRGYARRWNAAFAREIKTLQKMMGVLRDRTFHRARSRFK